MNQFDAESFLDLLKEKIKPELSARIDAINLEKTDFVVPKIKDAAWCTMSLDEKVKSYGDFGFIYIDSIDAIPNGPVLGMSYKFDVVLIISNRQDNNVDRLVLRYSRALNEAAAKLWSVFQGQGVEYSFESLTPIDIKIQNNSYFQKALGIRVSVTFN